MRGYLLSTALGLLLVSPAAAEVKKSEIAGWMIQVEKDPFGSDDRVVALKVKDGAGIGFRCFSHQPHLALIDASPFKRGDFTPKSYYKTKIRVDEQPIVDGLAVALSDSMLQIETADGAIFTQVAKGKEIALRIEDGDSYKNYSFPLSGASKGLVEFWRSCSITP